MPTDNPYPGPVPLSESHWLKGRELHINRFVDAVADFRVVQLHGQSGVGKSSFLRAGGIPRLEDSSYTAATVDAWEQVASLGDAARSESGPGTPTLASAQSLWLAAVDQALANSAPLYRRSLDLERPDEYLERLASIPNLVIVFDQFEELLRADEMQGRTLGTRFLEYAARIANDDRFSVTQVLSLRSEFISELKPLQEVVPLHRWVEFDIPTVDFAATIPEIVKVNPNVGDEEVAAIHRLWNVAAYGRPEALEGSRPAIGLLELQAYLWMTMADSDVLGGIPGSAADDEEDQAIDAFVDAMEFYVGYSLEEAAREYAASGAGDGDAEQRQQRGRETVVAAAHVAPHLSSAGYKLVRDTDDLAVSATPSIKDLRFRRIMAPDLSDLGEDDRRTLRHAGASTELQSSVLRPGAKRNLPDYEAAVEEAARICRLGGVGPDREGLEEDVPRLAELFGRLWQVDAADSEAFDRVRARLSGRMYDKDPVLAVAELAANYERALKWMAEKYVVRLTPTATGGRVTALVHDGFGVPLSRWGRAHEAKPATAISSLVAISGETVIDRRRETPLTADEMLGGRVAHVRWLGCELQAGFEDVTFRDSDFRGTIFFRTSFRNVRFVDCNLWGALFLDCTLAGCEFEGGPPLQTLTIRESNLEGNGVTFRGLPGGSYGLFFDRVTGGPWSLESCADLSHVSLDGQKPGKSEGNLHPGTISASHIKHLTLGRAVDPGTCLDAGSSVVHVQDANGSDSLPVCDKG